MLEHEIYTIYSTLKDFSNLLHTNIMFFKGQLSQTYYYLAPWGKGEDQNDHAEVSTQNLIELTEKYRIFTVNGQSSYSDYCTDQRSYLIFYMEDGTCQSIKDKLIKDNRIWTVFIMPNYTIIHSLDKNVKRICLTLDLGNPYSVFNLNEKAREEYILKCNKNNILENTVFCIIVNKEWNKGPNTDEILLEHLRDI